MLLPSLLGGEQIGGLKDQTGPVKPGVRIPQKNPVIHHFERFLGQSPWHKNNMHPFTPDFDRYLAISPWKGLEKPPSAKNTVFRIERILYRMLPKKLFLKIYAKQYKRYFKKTADALKVGEITNIKV